MATSTEAFSRVKIDAQLRDVGWQIDDGHSVQSLSQEADTSIDFAQLPLAVDVFRILGPIALRRRFLDGLRDLRTQYAPQVIELVFQPFRALWGNEFRPFGRRGTISAHAVVILLAKRR